MHLPHKQSDAISNCAARASEAAGDLISPLSPCGDSLQITASSDLLAELDGDCVWSISAGEAYYRVGGKQVTRHGGGDLLGLEDLIDGDTGAYGCNEPVTLVPYRRADITRQSPEGLIRYLMCVNAFHRAALAQEIRAEFQPAAGFMHFQAGETIIRQGATADRVYTLLEGQAEARRDGIKVGDIQSDEIFGALAVFTRQQRMASVVALSDCTVLAVRKEEFADLIELQPQICLGLVEEMAAKIHELNGQLLALQAKG